jgi:uncharacterized OB-fold protein
MTDTTLSKPLPQATSWSKPFWDGVRNRELLIQRCADCRRAIFFPKLFCPFCLSRNVSWERASGRGRIYSFTVVTNNAPSPFLDQLPLIVAIITLDEGVRLMSNIVQCDPEQLHCDQPVEVVFDPLGPGLPQFRPV